MEAVEKFTTEYFSKLRPGTQKRYLTSLDALSVDFGEKYIDEINKPSIIEFASHRGPKARKDLDCLSSLMTYMVDSDYIEHNPVIALKKKITKSSKPRTRYLTKAEYKRLIESSSPHLARLIIFSVETGLRQDEMQSLRWRNVDLKRREIYLPETKTANERTVPLSAKAISILPAQKWSHVFTNDKGERYAWNVRGLPSYRKAWMGALRRAEIDNFKWHDLRHTFASWAIKGMHDWQNKKSMPLERLMKWLGHKSPQMTMRYAHLNVDDLHKEVGTKMDTGTEEYKTAYDH